MKDILMKYKSCFLKRNKNYKGSSVAMVALLTAGIVSFAAFKVANINQTFYSAFGNSNITLQAQEYALTRVNYLKSKSYSSLAAKSKTKITGSNNYYEEVIIGAEETAASNSSLKQKVCTVNIYKDSNTVPSYSARLVKLSASSNSGASSITSGSIFMWYGNTSNIPSGFALCNGSNGTPDLRNKFIVGAGSTYAKGATGGADSVSLTTTQVGSHYHAWGYHNSNNCGSFLSTAGTTKDYPIASGTTGAYYNGKGGGGYSGYQTTGLNLITSLAVSSATPTSHENRPPYYGLYYLMKL